MELRQLLCFVTVAEELHFSKAARRLNMTQPPLSLQIQKLEQELGLKLFERTKRSVKLTAAGEILQKQAVVILEKVDYAKDLCRQISQGEIGELSISFIPIALDVMIYDYLKEFNSRYPQVRLSLYEMGTNVQLEAIRKGKVKVGFIQTYKHDLRGFDSLPVVSEPYLLAIPQDHELARRKRIPLNALEGINLILPPRTAQPGAMDAMVTSCREAGFEPKLDFEVYGKHTALALTARGLGVTPISKSYLNEQIPGIVYRPLSPAWPNMEISMIWRSDTESVLLKAFVKMVRKWS